MWGALYSNLTLVFHSFLHCLPWLDYDRFLPKFSKVTIHQPSEHSILYSLNTDCVRWEENMVIYRYTATQRSCKHFATIMGVVFSIMCYSSLLGSTTIHATLEVFSVWSASRKFSRQLSGNTPLQQFWQQKDVFSMWSVPRLYNESVFAAKMR
jgi:hypothetical protein